MENIETRLASKDWQAIRKELHNNGFAIVKQVLTKEECDGLIAEYDADNTYRKTINMARYRFGLGEYKYFQYPLPPLISKMRETVYAEIAPVANQWMQELNVDKKFPANHRAMKKLCHEHGQEKPTVLILKYGKDGFNTLHQDLYGEIYFPMQMVFMLDQIDKDYTGGEFVITEQNGSTKVGISIYNESLERLEKLEEGFKIGMAMTYDNLKNLLQTLSKKRL